MAETSRFYTASEARALSTSRREVFDEIKLIEVAIMDAIDGETLTATVGPTTSVATGFTNSSTHYDAWATPTTSTTDAHKVARKQMDDVIGHFSRLGYSITRAQYLSQSKFDWTLTWG